MTDRALVDLLRPLPELGRVSRLRIERDLDAWWLVVTYCGMLDAVGHAERPREPEGWVSTEREQISVDLDRLPEGVEVDIRRARPRVRHRLPLSGADPHPEVMAMLRALDASGIVGHLDVARIEGASLEAIAHQPWPRWQISTHAGSDAERAAWLRALP